MLFKPCSFDFKLPSSLRLTPKTAITLVLLSSLSCPALGMDMDPTDEEKSVPTIQQIEPVTISEVSTPTNGGTKRTRSSEEENGQGPAKKQRTAGPAKELLTPSQYLKLFTRNFIKLRNMGDFKKEALGNQQLATHLSARHSKGFFVDPEHKDLALHLMGALAGVRTDVEQIVGPCYITALPTEVMERILMPWLINLEQEGIPRQDSKSSRTEYRWFCSKDVQNIMRLRSVNNFFKNFIDKFRDKQTELAFDDSDIDVSLLNETFTKITTLTFINCMPEKDWSFSFPFLTSLTIVEHTLEITKQHRTCLSNLTNLTALAFSSSQTPDSVCFDTKFLSTLTNLTDLDLSRNENLDMQPALKYFAPLINVVSLSFEIRDIFEDDEMNLSFTTCLPNLSKLALYDDENQEWGRLDAGQTGFKDLTGLTQLKILRLGVRDNADYANNPTIRPDNPDLQLLIPLCDLGLTIDWGTTKYFPNNDNDEKSLMTCNDGWKLIREAQARERNKITESDGSEEETTD